MSAHVPVSRLPSRMLPHFPRPLLFAHRGASLHAPENTLPAFELGARLGADVLELDVHLSRDGVPVVLHDATVDRTTNGQGPVAGFTFAALADLDAGFHFRRHGKLSFRDRGATIPSLAETLAAFPRQAFNIDVKARTPTAKEVVAAVLAVLAAADGGSKGTGAEDVRVIRDDVILTSSQDDVMVELEAQNPGFALGLSPRQARGVIVAARRGESLGAYAGRALQIPPRLGWLLPIATRRLMERARAAGLETHIWTINDERTANKLLHRGADGIMSDDPALLADLFVRAKGASPPHLG